MGCEISRSPSQSMIVDRPWAAGPSSSPVISSEIALSWAMPSSARRGGDRRSYSLVRDVDIMAFLDERLPRLIPAGGDDSRWPAQPKCGAPDAAQAHQFSTGPSGRFAAGKRWTSNPSGRSAASGPEHPRWRG